MTATMIDRLVQEFRQLQLEVTELKAAGQRVEVVKDEDGAIRYQIYYRHGYEQEARQLLANGLTTFLEEQGQAWHVKRCTVTIIKPETDEGGWGAIRLEVAVYSLSGLIKLRKIMKKHVAATSVEGQSVRTRKPVASSKL